MDEIVSLIVANGLWAVLFCALLVYMIKDGRSREVKYTQTIRALSERLGVVTAVKADTTDIRSDTEKIAVDTKKLRADADAVKRAVVRKKAVGGECS